jgi:hypothetical protein
VSTSEDRPPGWEGPVDTAIMFVDLVDSSAFSSVLGLKEYADYVDAFHTVVWVQCEYFFKRYLRGKYKEGRDYEFIVIGDQLVFFLHTAKSANDARLPLKLRSESILDRFGRSGWKADSTGRATRSTWRNESNLTRASVSTSASSFPMPPTG